MTRKRKKISIHNKQSESRKRTDKAQLRRFLFFWLPIIVIVLGFVYASAFDPVREGSAKQVTGVVVEILKRSEGTSNQSGPACIVKLAGGETITLDVPAAAGIQEMGAVLLEKRETTIFKRKLYRFIRVVKAN